MSQLLHHPFLNVASVTNVLSLCTSPPSPRSTLDSGVLSGSLSMDSEDYEDQDGFATTMFVLHAELPVDRAFKL